MPLVVFKNTVLFPIIFGIISMVISCAGKAGSEKVTAESLKQEARSTKPKDEKNIIVGANRTERYLPLLQGKRVGIVANQTSVIFKKRREKREEKEDNLYTHIVDSLLALGIDIKKVFSPEHGFRGTADAGELVSDGKDNKTGLPIFSLHGKHKKPSNDQLSDLDIVIFDIQDVGVRFYTYISTLHYVMEACAENNIPLVILDRPNPNGNYVDGPILEEQHSSFLGMHPIPLVHGMTIGEYAQMINGEGWLANGVTCDISIIETKHYTHNSSYSLPIRPSPNLPNDQAITLYPSLGLFEGTNINAGRGTEFQFQRYGAPFLNNEYYSFSYTPEPNFGSKYPKHKGETCYGVDLSKINAERQFTLKYVMDAYANATDKSKVFNTDNFTTHAGTAKLQQQIESDKSEAEIRATWQEGLAAFLEVREKYLIYD
ncbi:exo-beta-N-acetylmuramidase NamZ domain-containing protein [Winogradskyella sp. A3E31]|uniref:exo-beta-N-acetylmuramidase NamZ family protein n=1 Tax=Winogradskyella sp. A3E31 TaxID=3349637 RepID=UPI00398B07E2